MPEKYQITITKTCWVLKCDIRKFFTSIDHEILLQILARHIADTNVLSLLRNIIDSFHTEVGKGLPLGNLTSQLLVNIYMNEFDQFLKSGSDYKNGNALVVDQYVKHRLKHKYYIRYADDFVVLDKDRKKLAKTLSYMIRFLRAELKLELHSSKVYIGTFASGVDFFGFVHFPHHRVLRTVTRRRLEKNLVGERSMNRLYSRTLGYFVTVIHTNYVLF